MSDTFGHIRAGRFFLECGHRFRNTLTDPKLRAEYDKDLAKRAESLEAQARSYVKQVAS